MTIFDRHFTLLRTFSVLSALILTLIASVLVERLQGEVARLALQQEAVAAQGQATALLRRACSVTAQGLA